MKIITITRKKFRKSRVIVTSESIAFCDCSFLNTILSAVGNTKSTITFHKVVWSGAYSDKVLSIKRYQIITFVKCMFGNIILSGGKDATLLQNNSQFYILSCHFNNILDTNKIQDGAVISSRVIDKVIVANSSFVQCKSLMIFENLRTRTNIESLIQIINCNFINLYYGTLTITTFVTQDQVFKSSTFLSHLVFMNCYNNPVLIRQEPPNWVRYGFVVPYNQTNVKISHSLFKNGRALTFGGQKNVVIVSSKFIGNQGYSGGALKVYDVQHVLVSFSYFCNNLSPSQGGAVHHGFIYNLSCMHSIFEQNKAQYGSAMYIEAILFSIFTSCTFTNNSATGTGRRRPQFGRPEAYGGTIYIPKQTVIYLKFQNSRIYGNPATSGAGIICTNCLHIGIMSTTFQSNIAYTSGGVIYLEYDRSFDHDSSFFINNTRCVQNIARNKGSFLYMFYQADGRYYAGPRNLGWIANITYGHSLFQQNAARTGQCYHSSISI